MTLLGKIDEVTVVNAVQKTDSVVVAPEKQEEIIKPVAENPDKGVVVEQAEEAENLDPVVAGGVTFPAGTKTTVVTKFERWGVYPYDRGCGMVYDTARTGTITRKYIVATLPDGKGTITIPANRDAKNELDIYQDYKTKDGYYETRKAPLQAKNAYVDIDEDGRVILHNVYFTQIDGTDGDDTFVFQGYHKKYQTKVSELETSYDEDHPAPVKRRIITELTTSFPRGAVINTGKGNDVLSGDIGAGTTNANPHYMKHLKPSESHIKANGNLKIEGRPTHYLNIDVDGELDLTNIPISSQTFTGLVRAKLPAKQ